jgi:signal transduction histidine kinase
VIQGNFDLIRDSLGPDKEGLLTEFRLIDEQIHSINLIVNKLLQFARPEEFSVFQGKQFVDDVLQDCLLLVQHLTNKTEIEIHHTPLATSHVLANRTELQQVFINLILNAIHAMPNGGQLTLKTLDKEYEGLKGVCIKISDTGTGMSEAILSRVFDPFFTTKQSEGTGLGLSISQTLISRMGGIIKAASVEGGGTTFSIWLPYNF